MTYFYISAILLVVLASLFVVYPILKQSVKRRKAVENELILSNANVVKQRMGELEQEREEGLISETNKNAAIRDLKIALADEMPSEVLAPSQSKTSLLVLLAIPGFIVGGWVYSQSNQLAGLQEYQASKNEVLDLRAKMEAQGPQSLTPDDFAKFALSIRSNLRENPDDAQGWSYLGMVNTSIGRVEEGIAAYKKALDLNPQDDELRFKFAETLMLQGTEESLNNARRQLNYLIQKQPDSRNNRLLMTSVAIQLQDVPLALSQFSLIKDQMNPDSQFYQAIVNELRKLGVNQHDLAVSPLQDNQNVATDETQERMSPSLNVNINITNSLGSSLPENAYLIVFAQLADGSSRAPLAVKRMPLGNLPIQVTLSDSDAMIPSMDLSSAQKGNKELNITARVSLTEDVMPLSGDFQGMLVNVNLNNTSTQVVNVMIDTQL